MELASNSAPTAASRDSRAARSVSPYRRGEHHLPAPAGCERSSYCFAELTDQHARPYTGCRALFAEEHPTVLKLNVNRVGKVGTKGQRRSAWLVAEVHSSTQACKTQEEKSLPASASTAQPLGPKGQAYCRSGRATTGTWLVMPPAYEVGRNQTPSSSSEPFSCVQHDSFQTTDCVSQEQGVVMAFVRLPRSRCALLSSWRMVPAGAEDFLWPHPGSRSQISSSSSSSFPLKAL